jgi:hypothetical protein
MERVCPSTALVLLGFTVGALILASRAHVRDPRLTGDTHVKRLRSSALDAQRRAARASGLAMDLTARWDAAEVAARMQRSQTEVHGTRSVETAKNTLFALMDGY